MISVGLLRMCGRDDKCPVCGETYRHVDISQRGAIACPSCKAKAAFLSESALNFERAKRIARLVRQGMEARL